MDLEASLTSYIKDTTEALIGTDNRVADLERKTEVSIRDLVGRIDKLSARGSSSVALSWGLDYSGLRELVPDTVRRGWGVWERQACTFPEGSALRSAEVYAAVSEWFRQSSLLQSGRNRIKADEERFRKLDDALVMKAALQEDTTTEGGHLVPTVIESDIVRQVMDAGRLFPMARQVQMTKKVHQMPNEDTAVTVNWVAEEGTLTGGEPTFGQKTLTAKKLAGRATMSIELVEDSNPGLLAYLLEVFTEKMGGELDKQLVLGDGSSPAITGIDNTSGINVISSSATAAGRNLTWQLLVNTFFGSGESSAIENGYWIVSPKGYATILGLADSTGQPIVKDIGREGAPAGTLLGRPVLFSARWGGTPSGVTATLDDSTNTNTKIIYGVPSSLLFGTRTGFRWDVTDQVNWATFQMDARLVGRFAMIVGVPANFSRLSKVNYT